MSEHSDALPQRSNARRRRREEATDKAGAPDTGPPSGDPSNAEASGTDTAFGAKGLGFTSTTCNEPASDAAGVVGQRRAQQQLLEGGGATAEAAEQGQGPTDEGGGGGAEVAAYPYRSAAVGAYQFECGWLRVCVGLWQGVHNRGAAARSGNDPTYICGSLRIGRTLFGSLPLGRSLCVGLVPFVSSPALASVLPGSRSTLVSVGTAMQWVGRVRPARTSPGGIVHPPPVPPSL